MNCPKCGAANPDHVHFCDQCGAPLSNPDGTYSYQADLHQSTSAVRSLSIRLRVSAILTLIAGIFQLIGSAASVVGGIILLIVGPSAEQIDLYNLMTDYGVDPGNANVIRDAAEPFLSNAAIIGTAIGIFVGAAFVVAMGIINLIYSKKTFGAVSALSRGDLSVVNSYRSVGKGVALLIFNILFGGGAVGIVGSAFGIAARSYIRSNPQAFPYPGQNL